jgi:uncharacterized C2H2 Zn-finger protein
MPIIIWGSRGLTSNLGSGRFHCPRCENTTGYQHKEVTRYFTIYFIPLFPIGGGQRYVECGVCGGTYKEEVLDLSPARGGEGGGGSRLHQEIQQDLEAGRSVEQVQADLVKFANMKREHAENAVTEVAGNELYRCPKCGDHYLKLVGQCDRCTTA